MKAVMLAAGIGARLGSTGAMQTAKILLWFGGKSVIIKQTPDQGEKRIQ
jgi:choline kinase